MKRNMRERFRREGRIILRSSREIYENVSEAKSPEDSEACENINSKKNDSYK